MPNINEQPSRLGAVIAAKRKMMGLSQQELAESVGLNIDIVSRLESDPSPDSDNRSIQILSEALHLDYGYLQSLNDSKADDFDFKIISSAWNSLTEEERKKTMPMLRTTFDVAFADMDSDGIDESDIL